MPVTHRKKREKLKSQWYMQQQSRDLGDNTFLWLRSEISLHRLFSTTLVRVVKFSLKKSSHRVLSPCPFLTTLRRVQLRGENHLKRVPDSPYTCPLNVTFHLFYGSLNQRSTYIFHGGFPKIQFLKKSEFKQLTQKVGNIHKKMPSDVIINACHSL